MAAKAATRSGSVYFVAERGPYSWSEFRGLLLSTGRVESRNVDIAFPVARLLGLAAEIGSIFSAKPPLLNRQKVLEASKRYWLCDTGKIENELRFCAEYPLQKGLELTWKWYRKNNWL
jgi:nucleoside-diphosphate-sugar epimerase